MHTNANTQLQMLGPAQVAEEAAVEDAPNLDKWINAYRTNEHLTQDELAGSIGVAKTVISNVESGIRPATPGLMARLTYAREIDRDTALELIWSAAFERRIVIPRQGSDAWIHDLEPLARAASPEALALAVSLFRVTLENYAAGAAQRGRRATDN